MSLLLFFNNNEPREFSWTEISCGLVNWSTVNCDGLHTWNYWAASTWNTISATNATWNFMAGLIEYTAASHSTTTWATTSC